MADHTTSLMAMAAHIERLARHSALRDQLGAWDSAFGPVEDEELAAARAAFDDADRPRRGEAQSHN